MQNMQITLYVWAAAVLLGAIAATAVLHDPVRLVFVSVNSRGAASGWEIDLWDSLPSFFVSRC
jgi:hypothetical protein